MKEYDLIKSLFSESCHLFNQDAQIFEIDGEKWGLTCDEYSLKEDLFTDKNPYVLGYNLVVATISDLIATGCKPSIYEHAIVFKKSFKYSWAYDLVEGIKAALKEYDCELIGGDTGFAKEFRYTGIAMGKQERDISRVFPNVPQQLYISGPLGDANESILKFRQTPQFEVRRLPQNALACIDTSSGFVDAVWLLHEVNPNFKIDIANLPCKNISYLFGGAGEYELLFTSVEECVDAIKIGTVVPDGKGVYINGVELVSPPPDPREGRNILFYIYDVMKQSKRFK